MTKGLNTSSTGLGRGRRVPQTGRGRPPLAKIPKTVGNKSIKCDMCKKEFPVNVDESVLINHIKTVHMNKKSDENLICNKCDRKMPTATALKYHTCSERYQCPDCNKMFMQKSTLIEHQAVAHRPQQVSQAPTTVSEPQPASAGEHTEVKSEEKEDEDEIPQLIVKSVETVKKPDIIKKLADDWDDEGNEDVDNEIKTEGRGEKGDSVPDIDNVKGKETSRKSVEKSDDVDEDQIVADVDDILKET